jgi:hypothetical protein
MKLSEQITDYVHAAFSGLWIRTSEPDEAEREIVQHAKEKQWKVAAWDVANGLRVANERGTFHGDAMPGDPLAALRAVPALAEPKGTALVLLHNLHRFLNNPEVVQTAFSQLVAGKQQRTFLVVLSPVVSIPVELEKLFVLIEHALPDREQLLHIAEELASDSPEDLPHGDALQRLLDAAVGLTRYEAEGAFALSLARHDGFHSDVIWELKAQALIKSGLCSLYRGERKSFDRLRGVEHIRHLTTQLLRPDCPVPPKGWLFLGPPNCGKTTVAKAIATDNNLPLVLADLPSLKAKHVGESEGRVRQFIALVEAMAPCCVLIDEIEDALAGATAGQAGDSGVSRDQLSAILKWRSESRSRVFLICTCNEPESLLRVKQGALFRDGRFDGMVFFDLPDRPTKDSMWELYRDTYSLRSAESNPLDDGWPPGNIEVCCQRAIQYRISLGEAATYVRPTPADQVESLRSWANGRCLSASSPGLYRQQGESAGRSTRRVHRGPMNN